MLRLSALPNRWINVTAPVAAVLRVRPAARSRYQLIRELLGRGRRLLVIQTGFPADLPSRVAAGLGVVPMVRPGTSLLELVPEGVSRRMAIRSRAPE